MDFMQKKTLREIHEEVYIYQLLISPRFTGAGISTLLRNILRRVAKASQGLIPQPFRIRLFLSLTVVILKNLLQNKISCSYCQVF
jgi:hypothetical protein